MEHQDFTPLVLKKEAKETNKHHRPAGAKVFDNLNSDDPLPPQKPDHNFRLKVAQARQAQKLTQKDLASKIGVQVNVIQRLENGTEMPILTIINKIKRTLKLT